MKLNKNEILPQKVILIYPIMSISTSISTLLSEDSHLSSLPNGGKDLVLKWNKKADEKSIQKTKEALEKNNHDVTVVSNGADALEEIKKLVPDGSSINNTGSTTLVPIKNDFYTDFLQV